MFRMVCIISVEYRQQPVYGTFSRLPSRDWAPDSRIYKLLIIMRYNQLSQIPLPS